MSRPPSTDYFGHMKSEKAFSTPWTTEHEQKEGEGVHKSKVYYMLCTIYSNCHISVQLLPIRG